MNMVLMVAMLAMAWADFFVEAAKEAGGKTKDQLEKENTQYFVKFNGVLWISFLFLYLALRAAWMIVTDNAPDAQKDSILYAKFLTRDLDKKNN